MITKGERWYATGKRKSSIARVWITPGTGNVHIRKWRIMKKGEQSVIRYTNKAGQEVEAKLLFSDKIEEGRYGVPYTSEDGNKPFRYTPMDEYFGRETLQMVVMQPFDLTKTLGQFDVWVNVRGGGLSGQAGAIKHAISKALVAFEKEKSAQGLPFTESSANAEDEEASNTAAGTTTPIRRYLKKAGFLTRDARVKERKKYGQPGARKRFQYSKR